MTELTRKRFLEMRENFISKLTVFLDDIHVILGNVQPDIETVKKAIQYTDALVRLYKLGLSKKIIEENEYAVSSDFHKLLKDLYMLDRYYDYNAKVQSDLVLAIVGRIIDLKSKILFEYRIGITRKAA